MRLRVSASDIVSVSRRGRLLLLAMLVGVLAQAAGAWAHESRPASLEITDMGATLNNRRDRSPLLAPSPRGRGGGTSTW